MDPFLFTYYLTAVSDFKDDRTEYLTAVSDFKDDRTDYLTAVSDFKDDRTEYLTKGAPTHLRVSARLSPCTSFPAAFWMRRRNMAADSKPSLWFGFKSTRFITGVDRCAERQSESE